MTNLAFIDTETTGLDDRHHDVWEVAYILRYDDDVQDEHYYRFRPPDLAAADATALRLNGYYQRETPVVDAPNAAACIALDLAGAHLVGAVPDFDARFLAKFLRAHGQAPAWHYHLIDVEALMAGALAARGETIIEPPWNSRDLAAAFGVEQPADEEHTALGDARWAMRCYDAVML